MYTFIDLFCGIGGFRLALEKEGLECVFSSDIDARAREAYKKNFGETPAGDITEISEKKIPRHDVLCAGFPCQSFSISGKMGGVSDPRGKLFYEIIRIAGYHKPMVLLLENVKNILTIDNKKVIRTIEAELGKIGYVLHTHVLNASEFGIPQSRERVYFAGVRKDLGVTYHKPQKTFKKIFLQHILEHTVDEKIILQRKDIVIKKSEEEFDCALAPIRIGHVNKGGQGERIYSPKGHAITLSAFGGGAGARTGLYKTNQGIRRLTIKECKKAMGFPNKHFVSEGVHGYRQLGNAIIPPMISAVWNNVGIR